MPIIQYSIQSTRLSDINIGNGRTIGMLRELLYRNGYDVKEAQVRLYHAGHKFIGHLDGRVLVEGDSVEFSTITAQAPAIREAARNAIKREQRDASETQAAPCCQPRQTTRTTVYTTPGCEKLADAIETVCNALDGNHKGSNKPSGCSIQKVALDDPFLGLHQVKPGEPAKAMRVSVGPEGLLVSLWA